MSFTREEALKYHREMWGKIKDKYGNDASNRQRKEVKNDFIKENGHYCLNNCYLCEYAEDKHNEELEKGVHRKRCAHCPIDWSELTPNRNSYNYGYCLYVNDDGYEVWETAPISKILELPERGSVE